MHFDPTFSLGTIIELLSLMFIVVGGAIKVGKIETKVDLMFTWFQHFLLKGKRLEDSKD